MQQHSLHSLYLIAYDGQSHFIMQRYFVLSESSTEYCVLRIYYKVVESSWGTIPLKKKASVPISDMKAVSAVSTKIKTGTCHCVKAI